MHNYFAAAPAAPSTIIKLTEANRFAFESESSGVIDPKDLVSNYRIQLANLILFHRQLSVIEARRHFERLGYYEQEPFDRAIRIMERCAKQASHSSGRLTLGRIKL